MQNGSCSATADHRVGCATAAASASVVRGPSCVAVDATASPAERPRPRRRRRRRARRRGRARGAPEWLEDVARPPAAVSRGLSGTITRPALAMPAATSGYSSRLPSSTATRSPGRSPCCEQVAGEPGRALVEGGEGQRRSPSITAVARGGGAGELADAAGDRQRGATGSEGHQASWAGWSGRPDGGNQPARPSMAGACARPSRLADPGAGVGDARGGRPRCRGPSGAAGRRGPRWRCCRWRRARRGSRRSRRPRRRARSRPASTAAIALA